MSTRDPPTKKLRAPSQHRSPLRPSSKRTKTGWTSKSAALPAHWQEMESALNVSLPKWTAGASTWYGWPSSLPASSASWSWPCIDLRRCWPSNAMVPSAVSWPDTGSMDSTLGGTFGTQASRGWRHPDEGSRPIQFLTLAGVGLHLRGAILCLRFGLAPRPTSNPVCQMWRCRGPTPIPASSWSIPSTKGKVERRLQGRTTRPRWRLLRHLHRARCDGQGRPRSLSRDVMDHPLQLPHGHGRHADSACPSFFCID